MKLSAFREELFFVWPSVAISRREIVAGWGFWGIAFRFAPKDNKEISG